MINRSEVSRLAHEIAREERAYAVEIGRPISYAKALKTGMAIAWRRAKDDAETARTGLVKGFRVIEPRHLWA